MKVATSNEILILQTEYNNLFNQTVGLSNQLPILQQQASQYQQSMTCNLSNRVFINEYRECVRKIGCINNQINRNNIRLSQLARRIADKQNNLIA